MNELVKDLKMANDNLYCANKMLEKEIEKLNNIIKESSRFIKRNCILSDCWEELDFCNFVPIGKIKYKSLSSKKVKDLLEILDKGNSK